MVDQNAFSRPLTAETRAKIVADAMGMGTPEERRKRVYEAALDQIRSAEAWAVQRTEQ